jgi:hypothetical protein
MYRSGSGLRSSDVEWSGEEREMWREVKRSEVKRREVKWSEVKWSEVKWSEEMWREGDVKRSEVSVLYGVIGV